MRMKTHTALQGLKRSKNDVRGTKSILEAKFSKKIGQTLSTASFIHRTVSPSASCRQTCVQIVNKQSIHKDWYVIKQFPNLCNNRQQRVIM